MLDRICNQFTIGLLWRGNPQFPGDRAIWAVFHHSISDDEQHHHQFCPTGSDSWCKFNRALADNVEPPKHTPKLPKDLGPFIKPVFTALSKRELLEKCVLGATQIQNESFNNIIWSLCPKMGFCSVVSVDIAVKSCKDCTEAEISMGSESKEFLEWMEKHKDSCNSNYTSSSPAMEAEGA